MVSESQIRDQIKRFLAGAIDLDSFEDWIAQNTWNIHLGGSLPAQRLAYAVELKLAEHSSGHLPYVDLYNELASLANPYIKRDELVTSSALNSAQVVQWSIASYGTQPVKASS